MICEMDRDMLRIWTEMGGVPADLSSLEYAGRLCMRLWAELQGIEAALVDILEIGGAV